MSPSWALNKPLLGALHREEGVALPESAATPQRGDVRKKVIEVSCITPPETCIEKATLNRLPKAKWNLETQNSNDKNVYQRAAETHI